MSVVSINLFGALRALDIGKRSGESPHREKKQLSSARTWGRVQAAGAPELSGAPFGLGTKVFRRCLAQTAAAFSRDK